jgi:prepilin-type N-terminal cleavage/methylation domain-containing protein
MQTQKGFTLIELIIVIALIALLATTVILVINPVKLFQEARDSQRIADLGQMNSALSLYMATAALIDLDGANVCGTNCWADGSTGVAAACDARYAGVSGASAMISSSSQAVNGTGWVPVNLTAASTDAPLSAWPRDPKRNATHFYSYACNASNQWEFTANMESARYSSGADDVEGTDGGNQSGLFEVGTNVAL